MILRNNEIYTSIYIYIKESLNIYYKWINFKSNIRVIVSSIRATVTRRIYTIVGTRSASTCYDSLL